MSETPPPVPQVNSPSKRRSPVGWTVVGIVLLVLSLFSFPRGLIQLIVAIAQPERIGLAYAMGYFAFGAALVVVGIVLLVRGAKIRKENRLLDQAQPQPSAGPPAAPSSSA